MYIYMYIRGSSLLDVFHLHDCQVQTIDQMRLIDPKLYIYEYMYICICICILIYRIRVRYIYTHTHGYLCNS